MLMICQGGGVLAACDGISRRRLLSAARDATRVCTRLITLRKHETRHHTHGVYGRRVVPGRVTDCRMADCVLLVCTMTFLFTATEMGTVDH